MEQYKENDLNEVVPANLDNESATIKASVEKMIEAKDRISHILMFRGELDRGDGEIISAKRKVIEEEGVFLKSELQKIDKQFITLFDEIEGAGEIRSESGKVYEASKLIKTIKDLKNTAENGAIPDLTFITRTNNLRYKVSVLISQILEINSALNKPIDENL